MRRTGAYFQRSRALSAAFFVLRKGVSTKPCRMLERRISLITLGVEDLGVSTDFYENKLGWTKSKQSQDGISFFQIGPMVLSLFPRKMLAQDANLSVPEKKGNTPPSFTLAYNARSEKEVNDIFSQLREKNVKIIKEPEKVHWGGFSGYFADPDGYLWEVAYNPYFEIAKSGALNLGD